MGQVCSLATPAKCSVRTWQREEALPSVVPTGTFVAHQKSCACRSYGGPFRVNGLNAHAFDHEYVVGKRYSDKVVLVSNKVTGLTNVAYRLPKIESPSNEANELRACVQQLQQIEHVNICKLYEAFDDRAFLILIYQALTATPLLASMQDRTIKQAYVSDIIVQLARALNAASIANVSHGALTPKNILLDSVGRVVVTNFGLIDVMRQDPMHKLDKEQLGYLAPESLSLWSSRQKRARKKAPLVALHPWERLRKSPEADVWSLGVITFQLLTGKMPFHGRGMADMARHILTSEADFNTLAISKARPEATEFVEKLLVKDPTRRPQVLPLLSHKWFKRTSTLVRDDGEASERVDTNILSNLLTLHQESEFKRAMMRFTAETLPPSRLRRLEGEFFKLDKNGDGFVSMMELKAEMLKHPDFQHRIKDVEAVFSTIDVNPNGIISLQEFVMATIDTQLVLMETLLWDAFKKLDTNHDGVVSKQELLTVVRELGDGGRLSKGHIEEMLSLIDNEVPDELSFETFTALVREEGGRDRRRIVRSIERCGESFACCGEAVLTHLKSCEETMHVGDPARGDPAPRS